MRKATSVVLKQITAEEACTLATANHKAKLSSDDLIGIFVTSELLEQRLNALLGQIRQQKNVFLLDWDGTNIPRGVKIQGHEIAWTQNGLVIDTAGQQIGTYDRLLEDGGANHEHYQMLIYV